MTLDMVLFLLTERGLLHGRTEEMPNVAGLADDDGLIKGRDADGNPIKARWAGESLASRLAREQAEAEAKPKKRRRRRRKRDGN